MGITVLIADDQEIVRQGLQLLFRSQPDMQLVGEAEDGGEAVRLAAALTPDVVVMDVSMPGMDGFEATRRIVENQPTVKVIALSMHDDRVFVDGMKSAGASGYVLKEAAFEDLAGAIYAVLRGETLYPS
jgi:two-component system, NarL family, response regulator NreC